MKRLFYSMILVILTSLSALSGVSDLSKYTVGRVRFVEGDSAKLAFKGKEAKVGLDYLVLLAGTFETNKGKLEIVDFNNDVFWFGEDTFFNFESFDPAGEMTTLFLGKGSFACKTASSFSIITSAGSILFPANGRYLIEKPDFGRTNTVITVLKGEQPSVIKRAGIFNKFEFATKTEGSDIYTWMMKKESDWHKTIVRNKLFSHVAIMSPYIANTREDGAVSWIKVSYMKPYITAKTMISGNSFFYCGEEILRASGIAPALVNQFRDEELRLWFTTNRFNAIKWAWNVERGWHAEFYYDPLINFGSEYSYHYDYAYSYARFLRGPASMERTFLNPDYYSYLPVRNDKYDSIAHNHLPLHNPTVKPSVIRTNVKPIKVPVRVIKPFRVMTRMNSDKAIVKVKAASKLSISQYDVIRTKKRSGKTKPGVGSKHTGQGFSGHVRAYYSSRVVSSVSTTSRVTTSRK